MPVWINHKSREITPLIPGSPLSVPSLCTATTWNSTTASLVGAFSARWHPGSWRLRELFAGHEEGI